MTTYERRHSLLEYLHKQPGLRVPELAAALKVSEGTIRNDLNALEQQGRLMRVHGGAVLNEPASLQNTSFRQRFQKNSAAKFTIAREAATLVEDGDSLLLDASSTVYYLARALAGRQRLRIITNGFDTARELAQNFSNTVILLGGVVNHDYSSVTGLLSERVIEELHVQKVFLSCSGFSLERGMTDEHMAEAHLKRKVIESAQQLFALIDASKFGKEDFTPFASPSQITRLFTDSDITAAWQTRFQEANIPLVICKSDD